MDEMTRDEARATKERPILFSAPMIRAIMDGRKSQTRRILKSKDASWVERMTANFLAGKWGERPLPYGVPGDVLWVREAWQSDVRNAMLSPRDIAQTEPIFYAAGGEVRTTELSICAVGWRPSIHQPRWASRINLLVKEVRVERLQDISEEDAKAEGVSWADGEQDEYVRKWGYPQTAKARFAELWESINGVDSWEANPWVVAVTFERVEGVRKAA